MNKLDWEWVEQDRIIQGINKRLAELPAHGSLQNWLHEKRDEAIAVQRQVVNHINRLQHA